MIRMMTGMTATDGQDRGSPMTEGLSEASAMRVLAQIRLILAAAARYWPPQRELRFFSGDVPRLLNLVVHAHSNQIWLGLGRKNWADFCMQDLRAEKAWPADTRPMFSAALLLNGVPVRDIAVLMGIPVEQIKDDVVSAHLEETAG